MENYIIKVVQSGLKWSKIHSGGEKVLIGEYQHSLDAKGRLFIPAKFRDDLGDQFVIARGVGNCLFGMSLKEWDSFSQKLRSQPVTDVQVQKFVRVVFAGATDCEPDKQGRVVIPANLRDIAGLEKDVVVIGVMSRIEIWNKEAWIAYNESINDDYDEMIGKMAELGI